jgi:putative two-component system response regulator
MPSMVSDKKQLPGDDQAGAVILVVEDDPAMLVALHDILESGGYQVFTAKNGRDALNVLENLKPSLILSDISMPVMDGYELFDAVRRMPGGIGVPFMFLTARGTRRDIFAAKTLGADDYITKPITSKELLAAVKARLQRSSELMLAQLKSAYKESLLALANAIEARDFYTHSHMHRLNHYAQAIARELGWDEDRLETVEFGAILHDIGKLYVPSEILLKEGELTPEEWDEMKRHPEIGVNMVRDIHYLTPAIPMILYHHESWDGSGYPKGLRGQEIPEEARLLAVADTFDAITSDRPYRKAHSPEFAYNEIVKRAGIQFDPKIVGAFVSCWERGEIQTIRTQNLEV